MKTFKQFQDLIEKTLTEPEKDKKEEIVKSMKKKKKDFEDSCYGDDVSL